MAVIKYINLILVVSIIVLLNATAVEAAHATFTTEKGCYNIGSNVKFTLANNGQQAITLTDGKPWDVFDLNNNLIYSPVRDNTLVDIDSGDSLLWNWNQRKANGQQVASGSYKVVIATQMFDPDDGVNLESQFSISLDADEDCVADAADRCPYDATNSCIGEDLPGSGVAERPIGGVVCDKFGWCPNNKDGDGATDDVDGCPELSGPAWNNYCPDIDYKQQTKDAASAAVGAAAVTTLAVVWVPGVNIGGLVVEAVFDGIIVYDATERIRKDPPDRNYKKIATLVHRPVVLLPETSEENYVLNKLIVAAINYHAAANAFVKSNERFMGAELANDREWARKQAQMTKFYALKTAQTLIEFNEVLSEYKSSLMKTRSNVIITKQQLQQYQNKLKTEGMNAIPEYELEFAKNNLFYSSEELNYLKDSFFEIDAASWEAETIVEKIEKMKTANSASAHAIENYGKQLVANFAEGDKLGTKNDSGVALMFVALIIVLLIIIKKSRKNKP